MEQSRNNTKEDKLLLFLLSARSFTLILFALMSCIILFSAFYSNNGNLMVIDIPEKNIANAQVTSSTDNSNIIDLKVSERNNNYVWTSDNNKVNPQLDLKSGKEYIFQIESMTDDNNPHQLIIQDEHGKQLAKSDIVSNGHTDDFPFKFINSGNYQYHCQYRPSSMHGNIVVS